jgi:glycosyltransferase involved in cell wall biosynthesis
MTGNNENFMSSDPSVTLCLFTYNQEQYIGAAVISTLGQDYPDLEIIISDDRSTDRTSSKIQEALDATPTKHRIIVNVNEENLGIVRHVNKILAMARGEVIVMMAGDDISYPDRVSAIVDALRTTKASLVISDADTMDSFGNKVCRFYLRKPGEINAKRMAECGNSLTPGCVVGMQREVFDLFGPLPLDIRNEDDQLGFRAALLDGVAFIDRRLVAYRQHEQSMSSICRNRNIRLKVALEEGYSETVNRLNHMRAWLELLNKPCLRLSEAEKGEVYRLVSARVRSNECAVQIMKVSLRERLVCGFRKFGELKIGRGAVRAALFVLNPAISVITDNYYRYVRSEFGKLVKRRSL